MLAYNISQISISNIFKNLQPKFFEQMITKSYNCLILFHSRSFALLFITEHWNFEMFQQILWKYFKNIMRVAILGSEYQQHSIRFLWCWRFKIHEGHFGYFLGRPFSLLHVEKSVVEMDCIDASCINKWPKRKRITFVERSHKIEFYKCIYYYLHTLFDFDKFVLTFSLALSVHYKFFSSSKENIS